MLCGCCNHRESKGLKVIGNHVLIHFVLRIAIVHRFLSKGSCCCCCTLGCGHQDSNTADNELLEGSARESPRRKRKTGLEYIIDFFGGWFFRNIVTHKYVRWLVLLTSAVIIGVAIGFAIQLEPDREQVSDLYIYIVIYICI